MEYLIGFLIPISSFFFQAYPRFFNRYFGVDVWKRMMEVDLVRKNNHRIPRDIVEDNLLIKGYFDNPPFFPWLLSFIPKKTLIEIQGFIAPVFDSLHNLVIFIITYHLTGRIDISLFAQLIYATIPLINLENSYLTPRSLGYLNFTLAFFPLLMFSTSQNLYYLIISFIFTTLLFFTHRFALQSFLFIILVFSFIDQTLIYLLLFISSFITALILSKGYYLRVLEGHMFIIYFWVKNGKYRFAHQIRGLTEEKKKMDFVGFIQLLLSKFAPVTLIATNLWILIPFFILIFPTSSIFLSNYSSELTFKLSIWAIFFYILSALVLSIKYLMPIGEGQRYLEVGAAPTAILSSLLLFNLLNTEYRNLAIFIFALIFLFNLSITIYSQWKGIIQDKNRTLTEGTRQVFKFINQYKPKARVLCIPHQIHGMIAFCTKAKVLGDTQLKGILKMQDIYPVLNSKIPEIAEKYDLNLLVLKKTYATFKELHLKKSDLIFETEDTQIFRIGKKI